MDFLLLTSTELSLLIGAVIVIILIIIAVVVLLLGGKKEAVSGEATSLNSPTEVQSHMPTGSVQTIPSTEKADILPSTESVNILPTNEMTNGAVPPISSWKPSEHAAPLPVQNDIEEPAPLSDTVQEKTV